jgi:large subunit ribosomal protein L3
MWRLRPEVRAGDIVEKMIGLIGRKVGMTRLFGQDGESIPVTAISAGPCHVIQIKTDEKEGYQAVQLGAFDRRKKLVKKPQQGHFAKAGVEPKSKLAEFRVKDAQLYRQGQELRVDIFQEGELVKVTGVSKGKGFAGGVKRWGFSGGPKSHGQSDRHRAPGSIGGASWPSRVWKGMKMAGHMGAERVTIRNIEVVKVDPERNILLVKGAVPGARNGYLIIQRTTELASMPTPSGEEEIGLEEKAQKKESAKMAIPPVAKKKAAKGAEEKAPGEPAPSPEETAPDEAAAPSEPLEKGAQVKGTVESEEKTEPEKKTVPEEQPEENPPEKAASPEEKRSPKGETPEEEAAAPEGESKEDVKEKADG